MDATQIILKPLITEKSTWEAGSRNRYAFQVHMKANKHQIRDAVASIYGVRVENVSTQTRPGKFRQTRFGLTKTSDWKRAVVQLHEEDRIELF